MDVRCDRCKATYVFDDAQVTPQGLTVQCTGCGHVFRVKRKSLVVTVPVRADEVTEPPVLASSLAPRPPDAAQQPWVFRQAGGGAPTFTDQVTLQKWIVERRVSADDEVSRSGKPWERLSSLPELAAFFEVMAEVERGRGAPPAGEPAPAPAPAPHPAPAPAPHPARAGSTDFYPPTPFLPLPDASPQADAALTVAASPPEPARPPPPAAAPPRPRPPPAARDEALLTAELGPEELAAVRGRQGSRSKLVVAALLLVTAAAAAYVFVPTLTSQTAPPPAPAPVTAPAPVPASAPLPPPVAPTETEKAPEPVAPPLAAEEPAATPTAPPPATATPPATPTATPPPTATATATPPPTATPTPTPTPTPTATKPPAPKPATAASLVAQAGKLRDKGEVEKALDLYWRALALAPDNLGALTGRGLCYFELGQYAPAEASLQRALQLDLEHPDAMMGLAETYRAQGKKAEALALFERYLAVHPGGEEAAVARYAISQLKE
ncbi:MAG: zinc-ribbon domain-containing protein [Anaeromyxobacter sp.]|nr:zinc-ribbon domain-containing protein [Anaeromyxobacter sp.]